MANQSKKKEKNDSSDQNGCALKYQTVSLIINRPSQILNIKKPE
jgi:hypothetical protein